MNKPFTIRRKTALWKWRIERCARVRGLTRHAAWPHPGLMDTKLHVDIFQKLWTETGQVSQEGKHYKISEAWCEPKPDPMIPIMVGGPGNKTRRLAAKFAAIWNWGMVDIKQYAELDLAPKS